LINWKLSCLLCPVSLSLSLFHSLFIMLSLSHPIKLCIAEFFFRCFFLCFITMSIDVELYSNAASPPSLGRPSLLVCFVFSLYRANCRYFSQRRRRRPFKVPNGNEKNNLLPNEKSISSFLYIYFFRCGISFESKLESFTLISICALLLCN